MEVIRLAGYTEEEKMAIATKFLVPKKLKEHGLTTRNLKIGKTILQAVIQGYTREAGVRSLEREVGTLCRKAATKVVEKGKGTSIELKPTGLSKYLGVTKFSKDVDRKESEVGVATGLAWTEFGGELLNIEVITTPGTGKVSLTGKLGEVMKESAQAAISYVRQRSAELGLPKNFYQKVDLHMHIPEGAIPKDGPSAGITIAVAIISALTGNPVRRDITMTGEVTLTGKVLPIGGLKEKALAAHRVKLANIIIPKDNEKDVPEIPENVRKKINFIAVESMDEVIEHSLKKKFSFKKTKKAASKTAKPRKTSTTRRRPSVSHLN